MTLSELAILRWDLKLFDTSRTVDERESSKRILRSKPRQDDIECKQFNRYRTCAECSDWYSCPER